MTALQVAVALIVVRLVAWLVGLTLTPGSALATVVDTTGSVALLIALAVLLYRLVVIGKRRLLWRVRRKLILSYMFIGVVPALLIVTFFLLCGVLLFLNVSSYLVKSDLRDVSEEAAFIAESAATEINRAGVENAAAILLRRQQNLLQRYPSVSLVLVATGSPPCSGRTGAEPAVTAGLLPRRAVAGLWTHLAPPETLPSWVACSGFSGIISDGDAYLVVRAAALPDGLDPAYAVVVDIPVDDHLRRAMRLRTGITLGGIVHTSPDRADATAAGRVAMLDGTDWNSGRPLESMKVHIDASLADMYERLSSAMARPGGGNVGQLLAMVVLIVGVLFLIIEIVALVMGLALARSITGSVHELFEGTEKVRSGDFSYKIPITARDQLGELAASFNLMTASIKDLLREAEEKKRLEEELRIARRIQMSLLPRDQLQVPGLTIHAMCEPAREVGGDYYDFFRLDDRRLGILIADVSGKGTSAAFYMAELKGLMLSLTRIHRSPRQLLIEADRIIAEHLDSRSFITLIYAVLDVDARTLTYCRAGHTPLIYRSADNGRGTQVLAPDGLVLGLKLDDGERFRSILQECELSLQTGDVLVLYTDGLSEAMNEEADCFGDSRLSALVAEHGHLPFPELRERILREIAAFVGGAPQHDDMTMIMIRVESADAGLTTSARAGEQLVIS